jgi:hypothetical protein
VKGSMLLKTGCVWLECIQNLAGDGTQKIGLGLIVDYFLHLSGAYGNGKPLKTFTFWKDMARLDFKNNLSGGR